MWTSFVELFRALIFAGAHVCGGSLGASVLVVSIVLRLAFLPLALRLARRKTNGAKVLDAGTLIGGLVQAPFLAALYAAVRSGLGAGARFLWIGDLARPDHLLVVAIAGLAAGVAGIAPAPQAGPQMSAAVMVTGGVVTLALLWSASSTIALSWGAGSIVSGLQSWLLRRGLRARST